MAATNFTPIQLYFSTTASAVPLAANLAQGELAININDGKLYYEDSTGVVQVIATKGAGTIGGSTTQIQYNNAGALAGNAAMVFNSGTSTTTLTTLNLTNALGAIYGGTAQSTYAQGDFLYASAANTLSKLGIGANTYILASTGSVPQWVAPSSIAVLTATNLAGGLAGSVPYQSALDTTTFLAIGAANRVMTSTGTAPQWVTSLTGLTGVSTTTLTTSSTVTHNGGTANGVAYLNGSKVLTTGSALTFDGTNLSVSSPSTATTFTLADNAGRSVVLKNSLGTGGAAEVGTTTNHDFYVRAGVSSGGANSLYLQAGGVTGYSLDYAGVSAWSVGGVEKLRLNATGLQVTNTLSGGTSGTAYSFSGSAPATSLTLDSSGNLGLGVTPVNAFTGFGYKNYELPLAAFASFDVGLRPILQLKSNVYYNSGGSTKYITNGFATQYTQDSGEHSWLTAVSGSANGAVSFTTAMTLDASGNLGIGTSSPAYRLDVAGEISQSKTSNTTVASAGFDASTSWGLKIANASTTAGTGAGIFFLGGTNSESYIGNLYDSAGAGALSFQTRVAGTRAERMRIDSSGNLLVGTTTTPTGTGGGRFNVEPGNQNGIAVGVVTTGNAGIDINVNSASAYIGYFRYSGTNVGSITSNGTITVYNTTSDYRLKTVIGAVADSGSRIDALQPVEYTWNSNGERTRGFLAHEFQAVYADSVSGTKDAVDADGKPVYQAMQASTSEVIADLVAELQSLRARVAQLESKP